MPLIRRRREALPLKDVTQVAAAVGAHNLGAAHPQRAVLVAGHGSGDAVKVGGPAAARLELLLRLVQGRGASGARVDTFLWVVLVELAGAGGFGSLFTEDAELLWAWC